MLSILRQQHYNTMLTHDFPQYYLDCEETGAPELIWVASKSGSMTACRNDGGIVHTPYGEYVIVLMNKDFHDIIEYNEHPAMVYGARVSRMILDQVLALLQCGRTAPRSRAAWWCQAGGSGQSAADCAAQYAQSPAPGYRR